MRLVIKRFSAETILTERRRRISSVWCVLFLAAVFGLSGIRQTAQAAVAGGLDATFGEGGKVMTDFNDGYDLARDLVVLPDGKFIVVGATFTDNNASTRDFAVARYNADGTLDASFGTGGEVKTDFDGRTDAAESVVLQPDGKIIVAGATFISLSFGGDFALVRYNADGTLDASFGNGGKVRTRFNGLGAGATAVVLQPDGKIVAAGIDYLTVSSSMDTTDFAVARYNANGTLDQTFGVGGKTTTDFSSQPDAVSSVLLQPDGKIIAVGSTFDDFAIYNFGLVRYLANGQLDSTFGNGGKVSTDFGSDDLDIPSGSALQPDGKIVVVGTGTRTYSNSDFATARYNPDGSLDASFGTGGMVLTDFGTLLDGANDVAIQRDGKIVVAGTSNTEEDDDFLLTRLNANGSLDTTFGTNGKVDTSFGDLNDGAFAVALQSDGKIIAAGVTPSGINSDFALARYLAAPSRKTPFDFDGDGRTDLSVFRSGTWYLNRSTENFSAVQFGFPTDRLVAADYDGDGKTDVAVFRDGDWYWLSSINNSFNAFHFGQTEDVPVPADYTGDGRAELAVYRGGVWYMLNLANNQFQAAQFGLPADKPVPADYDGDGKNDLAVYRNGIWYLQRSTTGFAAVQFGIASDKLVVGDYDGDGRADQAVYRNGVWYILGSSQGFSAVQFGIASDVPVPADYDGDGRTDIAVFRGGVWYLLRSTQGFSATQFGATNDAPIPAAFASGLN